MSEWTEVSKIVNEWKQQEARAEYCTSCRGKNWHFPGAEIIKEGNKIRVNLYWICGYCGRKKGI